MLMCPKQEQTANCSQVEIEILIVKGRNLPRTNSTKYELKIFLKKNSKTRGVLVFVKFAHFSSELTKSWSSGARKY